MQTILSAKLSGRFTPVLLIMLLGAGCESIRDHDSHDGEVTTFLVTTDQPLDVRHLVRAARVIAKYRELTPAELVDIQRRMSRIFGDMVSAELELMQREAASASATRPTRALARARVLKRLGPDFALPLLTPDNRSVVTFGRITGDEVEVTKTAFEIDAPVSSLPTGTTVRTPDGKDATLIGQKH